jgi:enoyl-CoA hydratase/carnithine racemase
VLLERGQGVAIITFNNPQRLNAWSGAMLEAMGAALKVAADDDAIKVAILTGSGRYYSSGGDFMDMGTPDSFLPAGIKKLVADFNEQLFDRFLDFPKPLVAAINGPAIGGAVTSAGLCDIVLASPSATFHTPFTALGLAPEGCSSFVFPRKLGEANAHILLTEGRKVDATTAAEMGLVDELVPGDKLLQRAKEIALGWAAERRERSIIRDGQLEQLRATNREESMRLGEAVIADSFWEAQQRFAADKNRTAAVWAIWLARCMQPVWSRL